MFGEERITWSTQVPPLVGYLALSLLLIAAGRRTWGARLSPYAVALVDAPMVYLIVRGVLPLSINAVAVASFASGAVAGR